MDSSGKIFQRIDVPYLLEVYFFTIIADIPGIAV